MSTTLEKSDNKTEESQPSLSDNASLISHPKSGDIVNPELQRIAQDVLDAVSFTTVLANADGAASSGVTEYNLPGSTMSPQVEPPASYWFRGPVLRTPLISEITAVLNAQVPDFPPLGSQVEKNEIQLLINLYANRENPTMLEATYSAGTGSDAVGFKNNLSVFLKDPKYVNPFPAGAVLSRRPPNPPIIKYGAEQARLFESETPGLWHRHVLNVLLDEEVMQPSGPIKLRQLLSPPRQSLIWSALDLAIATALMAAWHYKWIPTDGKRIARRPRPVETYQSLDVLYNFDIDYRGLDITQKPTPRTTPQPSPGTPRHPSYPSGHSTHAAAASQVLGCFFPKYKAEFDLLADNIGIARLWGGVHYLSDHTAGLLIGRTVGDMIINQLNTSGKIKANPDELAFVLPPTPGQIQNQFDQLPDYGKGKENFCAVRTTTLPPVGRTIALRAIVNNHYVAAHNAGNSPLIANRVSVGPWEKFTVVDAGNGLVALKATVNGKHVAAENAGGSPLIANRDAIGPWERFRWINLGNGQIALQAVVNNRYVTTEGGGISPLIANRDVIGPWETFVFEIVLKTEPVATGDDIQPEEVLGSGQSITSTNGRYRLVYQGDGNLVLYDGNKPLWSSKTSGNSVGVCVMQGDGNFVMYNAEGQPVWSSNTWNNPGSKLVVQNDGNMVIYDSNDKPVWSSNTWQG